MNLRDWLETHDVTGVAFAERVGVSQGAMSKIIRGVVWPEADTISAIERATDGEVQAADILSTYQQARSDAAE
jgi:DNA-binding transcriptional regulator YdaS (Cro superfamily)